MKLVQVLPRFDPEREGLSAFARDMGEALRPLGIDSRIFAAGESAASVIAEAAGALSSGDALLLHYVGYGYHPRGVPRRLVAGFEQARRSTLGSRFGVMFHEVCAFGPPWRSSFWTRPIQKRLARRLLAAADGAVTSLARYRALLAGSPATEEVAVVPIPSTVGEPEGVPAWESRSPRLAVFGSAGVRRRTWGREREALAAAVRGLGIEEVVDLGSPCGAPATIGGARVRETGLVEARRVSEELLAARAGFVAYPPDYLDKSTIYGAYLAHGVTPLCAWSGRRGRGPAAGEPWLRASGDGVGGGEEASAVAAQGREAYSGRSVQRHAELWRSLLFV